jgi:hypothetical protein
MSRRALIQVELQCGARRSRRKADFLIGLPRWF